MRPERYNKVVDAVGGVICRQNYGFVLPLVVSGISIATMLADLCKLKAAQRLLFFQQVAQRGADTDVW